MSEQYPTSLSQLGNLPGMTQDKIAAYGVVFLDVTQKYARMNEELAEELEEQANRPKKRSKK